MSKIFIEESTLTAIGDAIRGKEGTTELVPVSDMATRITAIQSGGADPVIESLEITSNGTYTATDCDGYSPITVNVPQDGAPTADELTITGNCYWTFANAGQWDWFIKKYGNQITTRDINGLNRTFGFCSTITEIPFEINCQAGTTIECGNLFDSCHSLTTIPKINNCTIGNRGSMFNDCQSIVEFPEDIEEWFDWTAIDNSTGPYDTSSASMISGCSSLRKVPYGLFKHDNPYARHAGTILNGAFNSCYALDEVVDLPIIPSKTAWTSNALSSTVSGCERLKRFTFALDPATNAPYVVNWKNQTLDFTGVGYGVSDWDLTMMVGFTEATRVYNDETYEALKNHPDMFTQEYFYSRYNHASAVETINSLPDTSAYGTNTIKFLGQAASRTDGGAISNLTEEEIAVATAKGWTVTLQ